MTDDWRTAPEAASVTAEQAVLGAILRAGQGEAGPAQAEQVIHEVFAIVRPEMFWHPAHATVAAVVLAMADAGIPVDPQTVLARLVRTGELAKVGGGPYLHTLLQHAGHPGSADFYAAEIRDCYVRRMVRVETIRVLQQAANPAVETPEVLSWLTRAAETVTALGSEPAKAVRPQTVAELLARVPTEPEWVIPGLLARRERVILTGFEGLGKSEVSAQVAVCAAAGIHPFTGQPIPPARVLMADLENGDFNMSNRLRRIVSVVTGIAGDWDQNRLMVEIRDEGIDLRRADDVSWLDRLLTGGRPDLLVIGSLYKMHRDRMEDEQAARQLAHALDVFRVRHGVALLIEAHAGHSEDVGGRRKLRPRGSSLFLGWPSVGIGIRPHADAVDPEHPNLVEVRHWRGDRDVRDWPKVLARGGDGRCGLPWTPYTVTSADREAAQIRRAEMRGGAA